MTKGLRDGIGAQGKLCSQCQKDVSGKPVKLCKECYGTFCLVCAASHRCRE